MIYGSICYVIKTRRFKNPHPTQFCDFVAAMIFGRVKHFKIMFRVKLVTYARSEDVQLAVINNIQCHIHSRKLSISTSTSTQDQYRRTNKHMDKQFVPKPSFNNINYPRRKTENDDRGLSFWGFYEWFNKGYVPVRYENCTLLF